MGDKELVELLPPEFRFVLIVTLNGVLVSNSVFLSTEESFEGHHGRLGLDIRITEISSYFPAESNRLIANIYYIYLITFQNNHSGKLDRSNIQGIL